MDKRPVAVFDSGLGGLTAVSVLRELMPEENILYFGDTARCPYGKKSRDKIRSMTRDLIDYLTGYNPKALLAACGTISVNAGDVITSYGLPSVNVFNPAIEEISRVPGTHALAVIATEASIKTGAFQEGIRSACPGRDVIAIPCQNFVTLCETGHIAPDDEELKAAVEGYLAPVREAQADAMILGCTHFGIIGEAIGNYLGKRTKLISASGSAAYALRDLLERGNITAVGGKNGSAQDGSSGTGNTAGTGSVNETGSASKTGSLNGTGSTSKTGSLNGTGSARFFTSGDPAEFEDLAGRILGLKIKAEHVDMPPVEE